MQEQGVNANLPECRGEAPNSKSLSVTQLTELNVKRLRLVLDVSFTTSPDGSER